jgi:flagellar basal-body rod protein FlgB
MGNAPGLGELLVQRMSYLKQRESVLAEDIANQDTPNFKARDLQPFTFGDALKQASVGMAVTDPRHITPASMAGVNAQTYKVKTTETLPNGNSVDPQQQLMQASQNAIDFKFVSSIYHKIGGLFKIALQGKSS